MGVEDDPSEDGDPVARVADEAECRYGCAGGLDAGRNSRGEGGHAFLGRPDFVLIFRE